MPQTRMFRDRVVSMEQTLEGGEKNLELLKGVCREALPEFAFREHTLDHERDLFVPGLSSFFARTRRGPRSSGRSAISRTAGWTRPSRAGPRRSAAAGAGAT